MIKIKTVCGNVFIKVKDISLIGGIFKQNLQSIADPKPDIIFDLKLVVGFQSSWLRFKTESEAEDAKEKLRIAMAIAIFTPDRIRFEDRSAMSEDMESHGAEKTIKVLKEEL